MDVVDSSQPSSPLLDLLLRVSVKMLKQIPKVSRDLSKKKLASITGAVVITTTPQHGFIFYVLVHVVIDS